jgi:hypothetical protein
MSGKDLSEAERREMFLALVEAQDAGMDAARSREAVAGRLGVSLEEVRAVEREGIDSGWPPLA